jgi:peptidoglycan/LPS O-acetylase OafA/YrhL
MKLQNIDFRNNSIGFLRLVFAVAVLWAHGYQMGGHGFDPIIVLTHGLFTAGTLAVGGFFVLSGFLITRSYEQLQNSGRFFWHRLLRIFPAYWMCLLVTAFVFGFLAYAYQYGNVAGYFRTPDGPWSYVFGNALLVITQTNIANLLSNLPFVGHINASLWTLQWEFLCYLGVMALGIVGVIGRRPAVVLLATIFLALLVGSVMWLFPNLRIVEMAKIGILFVYFGLGASAYQYRSSVPIDLRLCVLAVLGVVVVLPTVAGGLIVPIAVAYATIYLAVRLPVRSIERVADLSYGMYIYGFPIEKLLTMYGAGAWRLPAYLAASLAITSCFATCSWFLIERPALSLKGLRLTRHASNVGTETSPTQ